MGGDLAAAEIYYETCVDIAYGSELLVWYGECYDQFMGIPVALRQDRSPAGDAAAAQRSPTNSTSMMVYSSSPIQSQDWVSSTVVETTHDSDRQQTTGC